MSDADDELEELLTPKPGSASVELREHLLWRTEVRLNRSRWIRRGLRCAAMAAIFGWGGAIGWLLHAPSQPGALEFPKPKEVLIAVPVVVPVPVESRSEISAQVASKLPGDRIELQAELQDDLKSAAGLYKSAGDAYLHDEDYTNAARCYRQFLSRSGDAALSLEPDDSWLLTSLKNAAFQEKSYVRKTGS